MLGNRVVLWSAVAATILLAGVVPVAAEVRRVQDTFTATTSGMTPEGLNLRIQIFEWSNDAARADVIATLEDASALAKLPTVGYVWPAGSPVGYTVKYAHRAMTDDGRERVTFITDRTLGGYDFKKWSVAAPAAQASSYSVLELYLEGAAGVGNLSLAAAVVVDEATSTVTLAQGGSNVLADVKHVPGT
jgi:hypothetical protein